MFLLSKKGSILLLLGTGLLLGLLGPSDAIKCFACDPAKTTDEADCKKQVDCDGPDPVNSCQSGWDIDSNGTKTFDMKCGTEFEDFSTPFCTSTEKEEAANYKLCYCFKNFCNDDQSLNSPPLETTLKKPKPTDSSTFTITASPWLVLGTLLVAYQYQQQDPVN